MEATTGTRVPRKLTDKDQATRVPVLEHAAVLIYTKGVHATNNEQPRRAAGISGSQLNHYFPTKESPVLAVIARQVDRVLAFHRGERFASFDELDAFREWADFYVGYEHAYQEGCSLGSLVSEINTTDLDVHDELVSAFDRWRDVFRDQKSRTLSDQGFRCLS
ncbi:hypothetical protein ABZ876_35870 [Streptomyces sp. NPDC046931]|uniref:TetR/AcrR family transcriptional regulator n=1 Tax=Streptomyces sp. NPDC046931 TaxID=3154806 RepID=UPI0033F18B2D